MSKSMLKIDIEKFDAMLECEFKRNRAYNDCAIGIKNLMRKHGITDDAPLNALVVKAAEIGYSRGLKDTLDFIVRREEIDLFNDE